MLWGFVVASLSVARLSRAEQAVGCDERLLTGEAHRARVWRYSWTGINAALAVGGFVAAPLVDREDRPDWIIGGAGSALTAATTWFWPLEVEAGEEELLASPAAGRAKLLPRLLAKGAADERARVAWPWHVVNFGIGALTGGIIAFGYQHYESGIITGAGAFALGELQLFTQPTSLPPTCNAASVWWPKLALLRGHEQELHGALFSIQGSF